MSKIQITMEIEDEQADQDDACGMTNEAYEKLMDVLMNHGTDIEIEQA